MRALVASGAESAWSLCATLHVAIEYLRRCAATPNATRSAAGSIIVLEFKHYKPKKRKLSTRCWAFMELDEMKVCLGLPLRFLEFTMGLASGARTKPTRRNVKAL
jgi:hypothetical protein